MSDKAKYFEYDPRQGGSWWIKDVPTAEPWFQEELNRFAGLSTFEQPKLRLSWAATLIHDYAAAPTLKYKATREIITGYRYNKNDGSVGTCDSMTQALDAELPWKFAPVYKRIELGRLRWVVEIHVPAHELKAMGRFQKVHDSEGKRILRDLPEKGVYDHYFWIQRANGRYRDPDREVLTAIEAMYSYNVNTSAAQKLLDEREREQQSALVSQKEVREMFAQI